MMLSCVEWFARASSRMVLLTRALLLNLFLVSSVFAAASVDKTPLKTSVADLRYGVSLYHYYQQDYLQSLSELMVADARDGIQGHGDNPELILGGVSLAFGMQTYAEKIFTELLRDDRRPQAVRDAAWFYLGKLQYARADWLGAEQSFDRVSSQFNADLLAEMHSLKINLHIKNNQYSSISIKDVAQQNLDHWASFAFYNLGSAHARAGDMKTAQGFFRELSSVSFDSNKQSQIEYLTLLDKTYTAIGYSLLQEKNYLGAINEFRKVRLEGIESNQALLGYGWAAIAQEKYDDAIKPWQLLQSRSLLYPAAQEALLALPFAYEKLNAQGDALREYEKAEKLLEKEINLVREMRETLTPGELLTLVSSKPVLASELSLLEKKGDPATLTALITDDGQNWLKIDSTSIIKTRSIYLRELFSRNEFQTNVLDLRDLLKLQALLNAWQPKLVAYKELLEQKQLLRQQQSAKLAQYSIAQKKTELQQKRDNFVERLNNIKTNNDYIALADERIRKTYVAVERSEQTIQKLKANGQDVTEYEPRLALFRGLLLWNAAQEFPQALSANEAALAQIDQSLLQAQANHADIDTITATASDLQPFFLRIDQQQTAIKEQLTYVNASIAIRGEALRTQVDKQLEQHEKRLGRYLAQSHLAVARLYDTALRKQAQ